MVNDRVDNGKQSVRSCQNDILVYEEDEVFKEFCRKW